jgi:hypothetical protein
MTSLFYDEFPDLAWYKVNVPRLSILLGVLEIVIGLFAYMTRTKGLYTCIALGPIIVGLIAYARYQGAKDSKSVAKVTVETAWVALSFGCGYFIVAPSSYYAARGSVLTATLIVAAAMMVLGIRTLVAFGREGFELTP